MDGTLPVSTVADVCSSQYESTVQTHVKTGHYENEYKHRRIKLHTTLL